MLKLKRVLLIALFLVSVVAGASHVSAVPLFSDTSKQAVFLSPLERWMPTWDLNGYIVQLEHAGYHVDVVLNENVSLAFLSVELAKYDVIIMRTDSFGDEGVSFYCSGEPVTSLTRTTYAGEISSRELQVAACVGFSSMFLERSYPAHSLRPGLVYMLASETADLSQAFLASGSSVFLGYYDDFTLRFGRMDALSIKMFTYLSQGYPVKDALIQLRLYLEAGHGKTASWLLPSWSGDGNFKI